MRESHNPRSLHMTTPVEHGFLPGRSTATATLQLVNVITRLRLHKRSFLVLATDFRTDFRNVCHARLMRNVFERLGHKGLQVLVAVAHHTTLFFFRGSFPGPPSPAPEAFLLSSA